MNISVILAHPSEDSFNHAIAHTAVETLEASGHSVILHDLHVEGFDPILPAGEIPDNGDVSPVVAQHCREIAEADGIVIVHPNWWGQPPAILKGWIDRVIRPGVAYRFIEGDSGEGVPEGLLKAKAAIVFNTANTNPEREQTVFGDPLERIWKDCVLALCGVHEFHRRTFAIICTSTPDQRKEWLAETAALVGSVFPSAM